MVPPRYFKRDQAARSCECRPVRSATNVHGSAVLKILALLSIAFADPSVIETAVPPCVEIPRPHRLSGPLDLKNGTRFRFREADAFCFWQLDVGGIRFCWFLKLRWGINNKRFSFYNNLLYIFSKIVNKSHHIYK